MNWIKITAVAAVITVAPAVTRAAVEKPQIMDEAMISITVSDLHGFLDEVGSVAAQISPMMNGAMIKSMVGMQLGDPGLAGIPVGSGLSIVALDPTNIFAVIEVAEAQSTNYINVAQAQQLQATYEGGVLLVAGTPEALAMGVAKSGRVKGALLTKRTSELRVAMQPAAMIERNKESIDGFMQMMPAMLGMGMMQQPGATLESTQGVTKILEGELLVLLSLSKQCDAAEIKLTPKGGALQITEAFVPKTGTALAKVISAPASGKENPNVNSGMLGDGMIMLDFSLANFSALGDLYSEEVMKLLKAMELKDVDSETLVANISKWFRIFKGAGCQMVNFDDDGKMQVEYVMEVSDEAKALAMLKSMEGDMAPIFKMYESFGMPMKMTFKENVRAADGVKIHEMTANMDLSVLMEEQGEQMEQMGLDNLVYEVAITDGLMLYSGEGEMEALIKRVKSAAPTESQLAARNVYPKGGFYYFDLDMGDYMAFIAKMLPEGPETAAMKQQMSTLFTGVDPITSAGFKQDGCVMWSINLPGELLAKYGQMIMMAQMQQMGAPGGMAPQAMPVQ